MEYAASTDSAEKENPGNTLFQKHRTPPSLVRQEPYMASGRNNILAGVLVSLPGARNANFAWFKERY
jgi:hypothetical protein